VTRTRLLCALTTLLVTGCSERAPRTAIPVTVVGIDGAAWRVIDPLLAAGELPNLSALIAGGVRGPLRSEPPLISPPVWTTVATGVPRARHGILDFNASGRIVMSLDRRAPALWTLASAAGLRSAVVGWWATYPAEAIAGVMVSERALKLREEDLGVMLGEHRGAAKLGNLVYPPELLPQLERILARAPPESGPMAEAARMRSEDASVADALVRLREIAGPFALELVLLRGVDVVSHHYWRFHEPDAPAYEPGERPTPDEVRAYGRVIADHYRFVDGLLGGIGRPSPEHAVVVLSDHGFEAGHQPFGGATLSGTHKSAAASEGILVASGGPFAPGRRVAGASILDVAPTVLHLLGLPIPAGLDGRVLADALDPAWLAAQPVRSGPAFAGAAVTAPPASAAEQEQRLRDELRALGYVE